MSIRCMGCMEEFSEKFAVCPHCGYIRGTKADIASHMQPESILHKRYIIGRVLGFGGFGVTYLGFDAVLNQKVAIKEYLPGEFSTRMPESEKVTVYSGEREEQFNAGKAKILEEARRLAKFNDSRYVVHIYDCFEENDTAYIVMEYCDGETLKSRLAREGRLEPEEALKITHEVIAGMKEVHSAGILHRDLAPDNIFLLKDGGIRILDFGAARRATTAYSKSLSVMVKDGYAPEEQYRSGRDQGTWTDVYALAATLYRMLTGVQPQNAMERGEKDEVVRPTKLGVSISKPTETAIMNALNVLKEDRTQSMEAFEEELDAAEVKEREKHKRQTDGGRISGRVKAWAAIAAVLVACLSGVVFYRARQRSRLPDAEIELTMTVVPNFVNLSEERAEEVGRTNRVQPIAGKTRFSTEIPQGVILSQSIESGVRVERQTEVELTVSRGREKVQVPLLTGKDLEEAKRTLEALGFSVEAVEVEAEGWTEGTVVSQSIEGGRTAVKGETIKLEVAKGNGTAAVKAEPVPDLAGKTEDEARELAVEAGYALRPSYENSTQAPKGTVLRMEETPGEVLEPGAELHVVVSSGPAMVQIPSGIRLEMTESQARQTLEAAGFQVVTSKARNYSSVRKGYVEAISPEEGETAEQGSTVTLTISIGPEPVPETRAQNYDPAAEAQRQQAAAEEAARQQAAAAEAQRQQAAAEEAARQQAAAAEAQRQQAAAEEAARQQAAAEEMARQQAAAEEAARQQAAAEEAARQQAAAEEAARQQAAAQPTYIHSKNSGVIKTGDQKKRDAERESEEEALENAAGGGIEYEDSED